MNHTNNISRRHLLRRVTAITLGVAATPAIGLARNSNHPFFEEADPVPIYIAPGEGKKGKVSDMDIVFKLDKQQTNGHMGLWESVIQPGELGAPPHYHDTFDEICRVIEGSVFILTGDTVTEVKAGGWHLRPKGMVHTFWNGGAVPAVTIDISVPGGHEYYMQELAKLFENNNHPKPGDLMQLAKKHDIHFRYDLLEGIISKYKVKL